MRMLYLDNLILENEASRWYEFNDGENGPDIPALKLRRYFTGIAAETAAAIFPV